MVVDLHAAHGADPAVGGPGAWASPGAREPRGLEVEAAPLERIAADLLQVTITPDLEDARRRGRRAPAAARGIGLAA